MTFVEFVDIKMGTIYVNPMKIVTVGPNIATGGSVIEVKTDQFIQVAEGIEEIVDRIESALP